METNVDTKDYVWIITETNEDQEDIMVGLAGEDDQPFIPAAGSKEEAFMVMARLPVEPRGKRQVEAIHKDRLLEKALGQGFSVFLVDGGGSVLGRLDKEGLQ